jgi:hypothetical protein
MRRQSFEAAEHPLDGVATASPFRSLAILASRAPIGALWYAYIMD